MDQAPDAIYAPLLLAMVVPYIALTLFGKTSTTGRSIAAATSIFCVLRYLWWRWTASMPVDQTAAQQAWAWIFLVFETAANFGSLTVAMFMSRTRNRSADADRGAHSPIQDAPVDVFIATYNEDRKILERTLIGATSIEHNDLRVWVLDDGARPWVRELAESMGCLYACRVKGKHAKAGNVNNGLKLATTTGRRPEFLLLLDADFVAARHILRRTLPLFLERDVGIVQTPQHFFNLDPVQANLLCGTTWPDEQRFFFNYLLESKDAWDVAFCCGTSAVFRVRALEACGGMATATVTEDMLTSFAMEEHGYRTVFLNELLSLGLAPESLKEYVSQRARWCLGAIQQCYTRWGFAGRGKLRWISRLSALDCALFWAANFPFKLMVISAPAIFWWTGTSVVNCNVADMLEWLAPAMLSSMVFMGMLAGNTIVPIMTDVTYLLAAPAIVRTVATALVKPWGHPFKVTAKGVSTTSVTVQWQFLMPFAILAVATGIGMLLHISPQSPLNGTPAQTLNTLWSLLNMMILAIACAVCVELPKRRAEERFGSGEPALADFAGATTRERCQVLNLSVSQKKFRLSAQQHTA